MIISHLKKEKTLKDSGCCVVFLGGMMPVKLTFYSYPILFSCKWDGWEQGGGMHQSIQPSISFPLRGLDSSGGTEVIRLQIIPHIQQKALQTAKQGINLSCRLKLIHKISSSTSCLLCGTFPKTPEASPPLLSQWTQLPLSNMAFVVRNNVEGGQHSSAILAWRSNFHTWCASWKPSFSLFYFLFPLLSTPPKPEWHANRRKISRQRNVFQHFVSAHISEPNANVLHYLARLSLISPGKMCLDQCGQL